MAIAKSYDSIGMIVICYRADTNIFMGAHVGRDEAPARSLPSAEAPLSRGG
jgi:hypothetical protein